MYIDYNKVAGNNYNLYLTDEKLQELKELSDKERNFLINRYCYMVNNRIGFTNITSLLVQKAHEIAYVNSKNRNLTDIEKSLVACNVVFDNEKFATILKKGNFELACLDAYIKLVFFMKRKVDDDKITEDDQRYLNTVDAYTKKLVNHFNKYVGSVDKHIIINKLNEILSFNRELLEDESKKNYR